MSTYTALKKRQFLRKDVKTQPKQLPMVLYKAPRSRSLANPRTGPSPPELKFKDVAGSIGLLAPSWFSEMDLLNPILSGSNADQRIGRKLHLKSLLFRWNASSTIAFLAFRILIVYDREPNTNIPPLLEVLEADNFNSPMNLSNSNRFVILADEIHEVNTSPSVASPTSTRAGKIFKKLNLPMGFNALSTGDISSITQGAIFAMVAATSNATVGPGIGYFSRVRYTDV